MDFKIILNKYSWFSNKDIYCRGWIIYKNKSYKDSSIIRLLQSFNNTEILIENIKNFYGQYTIIWKSKKILITDIIRSTPVFYLANKNIITVTDNPYIFHSKTNIINPTQKKLFINSGFTLGENTIIDNLNISEPATYIDFNFRKENKIRYVYNISYTFKQNFIENLEITRLHQLHIEVFSDYLKQVPLESNIIIPLSGGLDSRFIVYMLALLGRKNVTCFTYGTRESKEVQTSKRIAEKCNFNWFFIKTNRSLVKKYIQNDDYNKFIEFSSNYCALPHIQDLFPVSELSKSIPKDTYFIPGHSYDILTGNKFPFELLKQNDVNKTIKYIWRSFFNLWNRRFIKNSPQVTFIKEYLKKEDFLKHKQIDKFINFNWKERQVKYIINSVRVYEFYNHNFQIPLWDKRLIEFWSKVPPEKLKNRSFFKTYLKYSFNDNIPNIESSSSYKRFLILIRNVGPINFFLKLNKRIFDYILDPLGLFGYVSFKTFLIGFFRNFQFATSLLVSDTLKALIKRSNKR